MAKKSLTDEERNLIIESRRDDGMEPAQIAGLVGRTEYTVTTVLKAEGLWEPPKKEKDTCPVPKPLKMKVDNRPRSPEVTASGVEYTKEERAQVLNLAFDKAKAMLQSPDIGARDFKDIMVGVAVAIDKKRLENDEAGKIDEKRSTSVGGFNLEDEFAKLDKQLAEERAGGG